MSEIQVEHPDEMPVEECASELDPVHVLPELPEMTDTRDAEVPEESRGE